MMNPFLDIPLIEDLENRDLVYFVIKEKSNVRKKVKHYVKGTLMQIWKSPDMFVHIKTIPWYFRFLILKILKLFVREVCIFLKK